jgi:uracil-DNA glycosylase
LLNNIRHLLRKARVLPNGVILITERQQSLFELMNNNKSAPPQQEDSGLQLDRLKKICLNCSLCVLRSGCRQVVFGDGDSHARLMLIGEGPGADEDRLGIPFVGRAGQLLDRILEAAKIKRDEVYITNVVKCRPPANRLPLQTEVDACLPHLKKQIALIDPQIIICLGALATRSLIDKNISITRSRGQWHEIEGRRLIATFHPAALLRDPGKKKDVWQDFQEVMKCYHKS